jgi:hypothetical protein
MRQATLASVGFERFGESTRRAAFLAEMDQVVPGGPNSPTLGDSSTRAIIC